ncbi:MAG TPA: hypothetical protein VHJ20_20930 [Polyangia bacterium]|nr:hypothetical protein [Polyangia bacterium]
MRTRCSLIWLATFAAMTVAFAGRATAVEARWTPDRVRAFVVHVELEMEKLQNAQFPDHWHDHPSAVPGTCLGGAIVGAVKKAIALPKMQPLITGNAFACYVATFLGCDNGEWIAESNESLKEPDRKPFKRAKVKIIEQTADKVVADVAEAPSEIVSNGEALVPDSDPGQPISDAEVAKINDYSRYTITRGTDGVWRISDRKPSFPWVCTLK